MINPEYASLAEIDAVFSAHFDTLRASRTSFKVSEVYAAWSKTIDEFLQV